MENRPLKLLRAACSKSYTSKGLGFAEGFFAWFPANRAQFAGLEGLQQTDDFIDVATNRQVVYQVATQVAIGIDEEHATEADALVFDQDAVVAANAVADVGNQRVVHFAQSAFAPSFVGMNAVDASAENLCVQLVEFRFLVVEALDFGGANEREIERVEEQNNPFTAVVAQRDFFDIAVDVRIGGELGSRFSNLCDHSGRISLHMNDSKAHESLTLNPF